MDQHQHQHQHQLIHDRAVRLAMQYKKCELELIEIIDEVRLRRVFLKLGYRSLFEYCVQALNLSESVTYSIISVLKKSSEIPELKKEIQKGSLSIQKAKRVLSVINTTNQKDWIEKASTLTLRELDQEVAKVNPKSLVPNVSRYVAENLLELRAPLTSRGHEALKRAQDIYSQKLRRHVEYGELIELLSAYYIENEDPVVIVEKRLSQKKYKYSISDKNPNPKLFTGQDSVATCKHQHGNPASRKSIHANSIASKSAQGNTAYRFAMPRDSTPPKNIQGESFTQKNIQDDSIPSSSIPSDSIPSNSVPSDSITSSSILHDKIQQSNIFKQAFKHDLTTIDQTQSTQNLVVQTQKHKNRAPIPANLRYLVYKRDSGKCSYKTSDNTKCNSTKFIEIHHQLPVALGGKNTLDNLVLVCSAHHRLLHDATAHIHSKFYSGNTQGIDR